MIGMIFYIILVIKEKSTQLLVTVLFLGFK